MSKKMLLSDFLKFFDFDYRIIDGEIALIDSQGANLGGIEGDRFSLDSNGLSSIVGRLDVYINDYVLSDMKEGIEELGGRATGNLAKDLAFLRSKGEYLTDDTPGVCDVILNPELLTIDIKKIIDSLSVGQMYFDEETGRILRIDKIINDNIYSGIELLQHENNFSEFNSWIMSDVRLAENIQNGSFVSVTNQYCLRVDRRYETYSKKDNKLMLPLILNEAAVKRFGEHSEFITDLNNTRDKSYAEIEAVFDYNDKSFYFNINEFVDTGVGNKQKSVITVPGTNAGCEDIINQVLPVMKSSLDKRQLLSFQKSNLESVIADAENLKNNNPVTLKVGFEANINESR